MIKLNRFLLLSILFSMNAFATEICPLDLIHFAPGVKDQQTGSSKFAPLGNLKINWLSDDDSARLVGLNFRT